MTSENYTFHIWTIFEGDFIEKMAVVNKRLQKAGLDYVKFDIVRIIENEKSISVITIDTELPHYEGWQFISKIDFVGDKPLFSTLPGCNVPTKYHDANATICEHCNIKHVRNVAYIIKHENGKYMQLGSACLEKFLPSSSQFLIASAWLVDFILECHDQISEEDYVKSSNYFDLRVVVSLSLLSINTRGWVSSSKASDEGIMSTSSHVKELLADNDKIKKIKKQAKPSRYTIQQVLDYCSTMQGDNDYAHNIRSLCHLDIVPFNMIGFVASMPSALIRYTEQLETTKQNVDAPIGKVTVTGKVLSFKEAYNDYGSVTKVTLQCEGWRLYVSLPKSCITAVVGDKLSMLVNVTPSDNDKSFAFGNRPTQGKIIK